VVLKRERRKNDLHTDSSLGERAKLEEGRRRGKKYFPSLSRLGGKKRSDQNPLVRKSMWGEEWK